MFGRKAKYVPKDAEPMEVRAMQGWWPPSGTYVTWEGGAGWAEAPAEVLVQRWGQAIRLGGAAVVAFRIIEGGMSEPFDMYVRADQIISIADRSQDFEAQQARRAEFEAQQMAVQDEISVTTDPSVFHGS